MDAISRKMREQPAFAEGRSEADAEIAAGQLGYCICGKVDWQECEDAVELLKDRFGIKLQVDEYCIIPLDEAARAEGYNERMKTELSSRFGHDVITAVFREVERKHKKARRKFRQR